MKKIISAIAISLLLIATANAQTIIKPSKKTPTSFAIVIDRVSYEKVKNAVHGYRDVVENDNLGTYIIVVEGQSPDEIKAELIDLYNSKKSPLEGVVFVGDIPIPMVRDAQHLASAFKMDQERYPRNRSSVPSDRFYDDFDLKFDFLGRDEKNPDYYYYSLRHDGAQKLNPNIYSARIRTYDTDKSNKYELLNNYFEKVIRERTTNRYNMLDVLSLARGHGYNSESRLAFAGEQMALKEQFPVAFSTKGKVKFMDFDSRWPSEEFFMTEAEHTDLDLMLFNHHGSVQYQHINGYKAGSDHNTSTENIKLYARTKIRSAAKKQGKEKAIQYYVDQLNIPRSWVEDTFSPEKIKEDSLLDASLDISVEDIRQMTPNARFIVFDACYNGSFHQNPNIASEYVFNNGTTLVAQGNTVNVIQDKWAYEYIGLLAAGMRVGLWNNLVCFLETHIIGDPTFRFSNNTNIKFDINEAIHRKANNNRYWLKAMKLDNPDLKALALRMLYENNYSGISELLKKTYFNSPEMVVRAEALFLLSELDDRNFVEVLHAAPFDSYELIRRFAIEFLTKNGSDELIPTFVRSMLWDNTSKRVAYKHQSNAGLLNQTLMKSELEKLLADNSHINDKKVMNDLVARADRHKESLDNTLELLAKNDTTSKTQKDKIFEIRSFRNNPSIQVIDPLLKLVSNKSEDPKVRLTALEALGWFNYSVRKEDIINGLRPIVSDDNEQIRLEATKTINRLR